jgi:hypothetical protein
MTKVTVSTTLYERTHCEKPSKSTYYGFWSFRLEPLLHGGCFAVEQNHPRPGQTGRGDKGSPSSLGEKEG